VFFGNAVTYGDGLRTDDEVKSNCNPRQDFNRYIEDPCSASIISSRAFMPYIKSALNAFLIFLYVPSSEIIVPPNSVVFPRTAYRFPDLKSYKCYFICFGGFSHILRYFTKCIQEVLGRTNRLLSLIRHGPHRKRHVQQFFYCCVCIRYRGNVSTEPLPGNDRGIFTEPLPSNDNTDSNVIS
jgi:hypothetical protein